jgi:hypothetical protein
MCYREESHIVLVYAYLNVALPTRPAQNHRSGVTCHGRNKLPTSCRQAPGKLQSPETPETFLVAFDLSRMIASLVDQDSLLV